VAPLARAHRCSHARRCARVAGPDVADPWPLGVPGGDTVRAPGRGDRLHLDRHRGGAAALGSAAVALPLDLRAGVPVAPAHTASLDADRPAVRDRRHLVALLPFSDTDYLL